MFCNKCGAKLEDNSLFCSKCGKSVAIIENNNSNSSTKIDFEHRVCEFPDGRPERHSLPSRILIGLGIFLVVIIVSMLILNRKPLASKQDIISEISSFENFDEMTNKMQIVDYDEYRRSTDIENKIDKIWVAITANNDVAEYRASYVLQYEKFNDGWECTSINYSTDYIEFTIPYYTPLTSLSEAAVTSDITNCYADMIEQYSLENICVESSIPDSSYSNIEKIEIDSHVTAENSYMTCGAVISTTYGFDMGVGWHMISSKLCDLSYKAKVPPNTEDALRLVTETYTATGACECISINYTGNNGETAEVLIKEVDTTTFNYTTLTNLWKVTYTFSPETGNWVESGYSTECIEYSLNDIVGVWEYHDADNDIVIDVRAADNGQIVYAADLRITDWLTALGYATWTASTEGETREKVWISEMGDSEILWIPNEWTAKHEFGLANANYYYLKFYSYAGEDYEKSGLYLGDFALERSKNTQ